MKKIEFTRFIERYLEDGMQPAEKIWFEKELDGNPLLQKELELRRKAGEILSNTDAMEFRRKLMAAESTHRSMAPVKRAVRRVPVNYAGIFLGLVIISSLIIYTGNSYDLEKITEKYTSEYQSLSPSRSASQLFDDYYNIGVNYFNKGDFSNAILWFEKVVDQDNIQSTFLTGVSQMNIKEYSSAAGSFEKVIDHNDNLFLNKASWYLSICYLNTNETDKAKVILEGIVSSKSKYKKQARKAIKRVDK